MARTLRESSFETRAARDRLPAGRKHWRKTDVMGLHVGYRRGPRGGTWYGRRFVEGKYVETTFGLADDGADADGEAILSYRDAVTKARDWFVAANRPDADPSPRARGVYTVAAACADYLADYAARGGKAEYATRRTIEVHIVPALGKADAAKLSAKRIRDWHNALVAAPKLLRTGERAEARNTKAIDASDADAVRARRASAKRILTVLKAALNLAYRERKVKDDDAWRAVTPHRGTDAPVIRYLAAEECRRLVNACQGPLRPLVQAAMLTGARYGELIRLRVADVNFDARTLAIREAKAGKPRHVILTDEGAALFEALTMGKTGGDLVFQRADGTGWKAAQQTRPLAEACQRASIAPEIGFHVLRHTHASTLAMKGVPMGVIAAQLGHSDTRMTEKHYAHLGPSYVAETIRAHFPKLGLGFSGADPVAPIRRKAG